MQSGRICDKTEDVDPIICTAEVQIDCLQVASVQIIGSTSEVLSQIHNLL